MNASKVIGAGAFVVVGALLFTVGALHDWRTAHAVREPLPAVTPSSATLGQLERGAVVRVAGLDAGEVTDISIPSSPDSPFRVKMEVREDLHQLVRTDSVATTQTEGLVGADLRQHRDGDGESTAGGRERNDSGPGTVSHLRPAAAGQRLDRPGHRDRGGAARRRRTGGQAAGDDGRGRASAGGRGHPSRASSPWPATAARSRRRRRRS